MTHNNIISKDTIQRLLKDVKQIMKYPLTDNGIYYSHDETNLLKGYAMIIGSSETPYFGGYYFFEFNYPTDYPFSPPEVKYKTNNGSTRFNPNLYKCEKVCVSILNTWAGDKWSSCQTLNSILLTLCSLLNSQPLTNEPGHTVKSKDFIPYQKSIEFMNINFAICDLLNLSKQIIPPHFEIFYCFMKEQFFKNYNELYKFIDSKKNEISNETVVIYSMTTRINYNELMIKLVNTKTQLV